MKLFKFILFCLVLVLTYQIKSAEAVDTTKPEATEGDSKKTAEEQQSETQSLAAGTVTNSESSNPEEITESSLIRLIRDCHVNTLEKLIPALKNSKKDYLNYKSPENGATLLEYAILLLVRNGDNVAIRMRIIWLLATNAKSEMLTDELKYELGSDYDNKKSEFIKQIYNHYTDIEIAKQIMQFIVNCNLKHISMKHIDPLKG